jgi:type I restriction enzyme R subunit
MNKKNLTERDICTKYITPALVRADWDVLAQIREKVFFGGRCETHGSGRK